MDEERDPAGVVDADETPARPKSLGRRVVSGAETVVDAVAEAGEAIAERLRPAAETVGAAVVDVLHPSRAIRPRRRRRRSRRTLQNLFDVHPEARNAPLREVGLTAIAVDEIVGTAVDGPAQRGPDFLPLRPLRSTNWDSRWQRIRAAVDRLEVLPPIDVLRTSEGYWVVDGHNRVAAARGAGQVAIDAVVRAVRLAGEPNVRPSGPLAPLLEGGDALRAAGRGMLTPGAARGAAVHEHERESEPADHPDEERAGRA